MSHKPIRYISERMGLPSDIICGAVIITSYGNRHIFVENYRKILEYDESHIIIQGKDNNIKITGKQLGIIYYTEINMRIDGFVEEIIIHGGQ